MSEHQWQRSTLGHGEQMCAKCGITDREAAVLGNLSTCTRADPVTTPSEEVGAKSLGERLCDAFQAVTPTSSHLGALAWSDWDAAGQTVFENAAVRFLSRLSYDETVSASLASKDEEIAALKKELASRADLSRASPSPTPSSDGWQDIRSAPRDGTTIQARIPGHGDDNMIAWIADALDDGQGSCGAWTFVHEDQEPPDCWSDGWCWAVNEDGVPSAWPTHWKLPPATSALGDRLADEEQHRNEPSSGLQGDADVSR